MAELFANSGDPDQMRMIWVCTDCQLPFYGSPDYNGLNGATVVNQMQMLKCFEYKEFLIFKTINIHVMITLYYLVI